MSVHNDPYSDLFKRESSVHLYAGDILEEEITRQQIMIHVMTCWSFSQSGFKHSEISLQRIVTELKKKKKSYVCKGATVERKAYFFSGPKSIFFFFSNRW